WRSHLGAGQFRHRHAGGAHHTVYTPASPAAHGGSRPGVRVKNGPALAGHGAEAVRDAIARTIITLPAQLRRSLTWDQGVEMTQHARVMKLGRRSTIVGVPPSAVPNFAKSLIVVARRGFSDAARRSIVSRG